ncbi:hypothetical protein H1C71_036131 [Ictidomys tridecemlineatus]|nr:hypothetical protein H1C71_036131 [Ictidomys tridecemlineatus]
MISRSRKRVKGGNEDDTGFAHGRDRGLLLKGPRIGEQREWTQKEQHGAGNTREDPVIPDVLGEERRSMQAGPSGPGTVTHPRSPSIFEALAREEQLWPD